MAGQPGDLQRSKPAGQTRHDPGSGAIRPVARSRPSPPFFCAFRLVFLSEVWRDDVHLRKKPVWSMMSPDRTLCHLQQMPVCGA